MENEEQKTLPEEFPPRSIETNTPHKLPHEVKTLISWHAPGRPFRRRHKSYYINILLIMVAIEIILFLFGQYMLMAVVVALVFLNYALTTVAPHDFRYKITTEGLMIEDRFWLWQELYDFYFKRVDNQDLLMVSTQAYFPGELSIVLGEMHKEQVRNTLVPYLPFRELVTPTFMEKSSDWLARTFPLERVPKTTQS